MRLKSYFVHTMEEALQAAKIELGEDAMLVDSKSLETPAGGRLRLEVIFAASAAPPPPPKVEPQVLPTVRRDSIAGLQQFRGELTSLLDALNRKPDPARLEPLFPARPQIDALRARLLLSEVPSAMIDELLLRCRPVLEGMVLRGTYETGTVEAAVLPLLAAELNHVVDRDTTRSRVLTFVGPTGAGKTSAIAKLAFRLGISEARPVHVLSVDTLRIGASDQLAHLCSLMGISFQSLDYSGAVVSAVAANAHRGTILIDTPGFSASDKDLLEETAGHFHRLENATCQLVLPASLRYSEMQRRLQQYAPFAPSRVLFTRLDETEFFGPSWAFARQNRLTAEFVSTGPGIPEDFDLADASLFTARALGINSQLTSPAPAYPTSNLASAASAGASRI